MANTQIIKDALKKRFPVLLKVKHCLDRVKQTNHYMRVQRAYPDKLERISQRAKSEGKIKVAFILVFNSVFPVRTVFEVMLDNDLFDPYIIVAPNVGGSHQYQMDLLNEAMDALSAQYPDRVISGYDEQKDEYLELGDNYPIVFFCNPYPNLVHRFHELQYFLDKDVLTVFQNYGYIALQYCDVIIQSDFCNEIWLFCAESETNLEYFKQTQQIKGKNAIVTGYMKMDKLANAQPEPRERKRIIISPHHTVYGWSKLDIGNFLKYHEFFQSLPELYPEIDFIFRPHPLLFQNMLKKDIWTQDEIDDYIRRMETHPNARYDHSGEYMDEFTNSDAMIHDCGSFIAEYLYTEKPCCYMLKTPEQATEGLLPMGQKCMENYYKAFSEEDIIRFIDNVVISGEDPMKEKREQFVRQELKVQYPKASMELVQLLEEKIFR